MGQRTSKSPAQRKSKGGAEAAECPVSPRYNVENMIGADERELAELQKRVLNQYPWVEEIYESILVTDFTVPDNPIVFCNGADDFEKMTLYTREEIIGRNCRFLQGKYTSCKIVKQIREAVMLGKRLDVEILNYRKDGVPFWNRFLMLPVHKTEDGVQRVTNFIAIQKDVSFLRNPTKDPTNWNSVEIALWLDSNKMPYGLLFVAKHINGKRMMRLSDEVLIDLGVSPEHVPQMRALIEKLRNSPVAAIYKHEKKFDRFGSTAWLETSNYKSLTSADDPEEQAAIDAGAATKNGQEFWSRKRVREAFAIKCYYKDVVTAFLVRPNISLARLREKIGKHYDPGLEIFVIFGRDRVHLQCQDDLRNSIRYADGATLHVELLFKEELPNYRSNNNVIKLTAKSEPASATGQASSAPAHQGASTSARP